jgi:ParB-like chromosome segregation protein Spo0J
MAAVIPHRYELRSVDKLEPHPGNPNRGQVEEIGDSIDAIGFFGAVVVQESSGRILIGEHRWRAAKNAGIADLPCLVTDCTDDVAVKIMIADNHFARLGVWDEDALIALLTEMGGGDEDLRGSGMTADDLVSLIARQAEGLPPGFEHLVPREAAEDDDGGHTVTCPSCGAEFVFGAKQ